MVGLRVGVLMFRCMMGAGIADQEDVIAVSMK